MGTARHENVSNHGCFWARSFMASAPSSISTMLDGASVLVLPRESPTVQAKA